MRYVLAPDKEQEPAYVLNAIRDYVLDEKYIIIDKKGNVICTVDSVGVEYIYYGTGLY